MMDDVQISLESAEGLQRRLKVNVPATRVDAEVAQRLRSMSRTASIKGFRPGKVPEKVIRQRFGAQIFQEVIQDLVQASYSEAVNREKLRPAANPHIHAEQAEPGRDLVYTAHLEVLPEFELAGMDKLRVKRPEFPADEAERDADIDFVIENLRRQRAHFHAVDRAAAEGDRVIVDFEGFRDGAPLEGGKGEAVPVVLGAGRMIPDFEKGLLGARAGEERRFKVRFPDDYGEKSLAGAEAEFQATIREVGAEHVPEVNEDFIRSFGIESGDVAEFRRDIRRNIESEFAGRTRAELKRQLFEQLLEANPIAIPQSLVDQEARILQADAMRNLGIQDPAAAPAPETFRETAERRVRLGLLVSAVIRDHGIQVDQERVLQRIDELAAGYPDPEEVRRIYLQNQQLLEQVHHSVLEEQVVEFLAGRAASEPMPTTFRALVQNQA